MANFPFLGAVLLCGLFLSGCETAGSPKLRVNLPSSCDNLLPPIDIPAINLNDDARASLARHRAALVKAEAQREAEIRCQAQVRARFARGG